MSDATSMPPRHPGKRPEGDLARRWAHRLRWVPAVPVLALGIAAVSVLSALVTWRASEWSNRADRAESLATQDLAFRHQIRAEIRAAVDEDIRIFGTYEEHYNHAVRLEEDEWRMRERDPLLARRIVREAQRERASANGVLRYLGDSPGYERGSGLVTFDAKAAVSRLEASSPDLANVRQSPNTALAETAQNKFTNLVGVALVFAASLFFLTLAQLTSRTASRAFAIAGTVVALLAWGIFIAV